MVEPINQLHSTKPRRLAVLGPGTSYRARPWSSLRALLAIEDGVAEGNVVWLVFDEITGILSPGTLESLAIRLRGGMDAEWAKRRGFEDVAFVGHSMGGRGARQAYRLAAGAVQGESSTEWACRVSRIVLFASINRGVGL